MKTATLVGWGLQDWTVVRTLAAGMTCAWADYGGFHLAACPDQAPPYSHLWGWNPETGFLLRVRIDAERGIVGGLILKGDSDEAFRLVPEPTLVEEVLIRESEVLTWAEDEPRIAAQAAGILPGKVFSVEVLTPMPITFIGLDR